MQAFRCLLARPVFLQHLLCARPRARCWAGEGRSALSVFAGALSARGETVPAMPGFLMSCFRDTGSTGAGGSLAGKAGLGPGLDTGLPSVPVPMSKWG